MCIAILFQSSCDVINLEINLVFLTKLFFLHDQKVKTAYTQGVWSIFKTSESGISWHDTAAYMALWKANFSSARNWGEGLVLLLRLLQFNLVRMPLAPQSVNFKVPLNSSRTSELFALITSLAMFEIWLLLMNRPACLVPIAISLTFRIRWLSKIFSVLTFFRTTSPSQPPLNLLFQVFTDVLIKLWLGYFKENFLLAEEVPNIDAFFPTSLSTSLWICFWSCLGRLCDILSRLP